MVRSNHEARADLYEKAKRQGLEDMVPSEQDYWQSQTRNTSSVGGRHSKPWTPFGVALDKDTAISEQDPRTHLKPSVKHAK